MGRIRSATAGNVMDAAMAKALELKVSVSIAVLDEGGHLKAFLVMDEAILGAIDISQWKSQGGRIF